MRYYTIEVGESHRTGWEPTTHLSIPVLPNECINIEIENKAGTIDSIQLHAESCGGCEFTLDGPPVEVS